MVCSRFRLHPPAHATLAVLPRYTLLTSCFSHEDTTHILFNGFTFYFMAPLVISILGNVGFLTLYLGGASVHVYSSSEITNAADSSGGIVSSVAGIAWRNYKQGKQSGGSHGASGAIYSVVSFFACVAPTASFYMFGVLPLPAWAVVTGIFLWDGYSAMNEHVSTRSPSTLYYILTCM